MMSRMVPRSVSIADLPFMEVGTADAFLRFEVAMTDILPRRAGSAQVTDVLLPFIQVPQTVLFAIPTGQRSVISAARESGAFCCVPYDKRRGTG